MTDKSKQMEVRSAPFFSVGSWSIGLVHGGRVACVLGSGEDSKALALKMAAAPDLLEACEKFLEVWDRTGQIVKTDVAVRMMRVAIDKARGE